VTRRIALLATAIATLVACSVPAEAGAATRIATSSNWAGYAVSRSGVRFRRVSGTWVQPTATCRSGRRRYSAYWLGLGGLHTTSTALEQIGTEADCAGGKATYTVWYELVPSDPVDVHLTVRPGDTLSASVTVTSHTVKLYIANRTRGTSFSKQLQATKVDVTSAEWIAEAPSACDSAGNCATLPLADFGTASFANARATSTGGHAGTISDAAWSAVAISLASGHGGPGRPGFVSDAGGSAQATPAALSAAGDAFSVTYQAAVDTPPEFNRARSAVVARRFAARAMREGALAAVAGPPRRPVRAAARVAAGPRACRCGPPCAVAAPGCERCGADRACFTTGPQKA
jgi:Peptidase A4 family